MLKSGQSVRSTAGYSCSVGKAILDKGLIVAPSCAAQVSRRKPGGRSAAYRLPVFGRLEADRRHPLAQPLQPEEFLHPFAHGGARVICRGRNACGQARSRIMTARSIAGHIG